MSNYNQHSPSRWSMYKRKAAKLRAQNKAELRLTVSLISIAAHYIPTDKLLDFSNEVRAFLDERQKPEHQT
jgi:hypothetical protein